MLQFHLTSSLVFISCILSAYVSVTGSSYHHPCILDLHLTISHVCKNCIRHFAMSVTAAPKQQSISDHMCCLLHLHQTSIEVMVVTIAPGQQACIKHLHPKSSQDGKVIMARNSYYHTPQINPQHCDQEPKNDKSNMTFRTQQQYIDQRSLQQQN